MDSTKLTPQATASLPIRPRISRQTFLLYVRSLTADQEMSRIGIMINECNRMGIGFSHGSVKALAVYRGEDSHPHKIRFD